MENFDSSNMQEEISGGLVLGKGWGGGSFLVLMVLKVKLTV